jgi:hypothetical protein
MKTLGPILPVVTGLCLPKTAGFIGYEPCASSYNYLEVSSLIKGFWWSKYSHFPFSEIVLDEFYPETLDGFFLQTFVLVS